MSQMSPYEQVCPECGKIILANVTACPDCGYSFKGELPVRHDRAGRFPGIERLGWLVKLLVLLAVLAGIGYGVHRGYQGLIGQLTEANPHPIDPCATTTQFFQALRDGNHQECYSLLTDDRKAGVIIRQQQRQGSYYPHFQRIHDYLMHHASENYAQTMEVSETGQRVDFENGITLTLKVVGSRDADDLTHYGIQEIREFPIDIAPGIGIEAHNRQLNRIMESVDQTGAQESDDITEIIRRRDYESERERLERLCESFFLARQLDTQHDLLEWIVKEFPQEKQTRSFLQKVRDDEDVPMHLRHLAAAYLGA